VIPKYKIEVYTPAPALRYTIESDAFSIRTEEVLTSNIGTFSFSIPTEKNGVPIYYDIALADTVKIYFGYDSVSATPYFVGKIYQIHGSKAIDGGTTRTIKGRDQGEVMLRRFKGMDDFVAETAHDITDELATDLGLGTGDIEANANAETHRIDIDKHERYFDFLQKVSDYWVNAGTQVKQDFHVDADGDLYWHSRPFRTTGVETFTVGKNIKSYGVVRDLTSVKNKIWVYGKRGKPNDSSLDLGTDMATPEPGDTTVDGVSASGQKVLNVTATADFTAGDTVLIYDWGNRYEKNTIDTIQAGISLTMDNNLVYNYQIGDYVFELPAWTPGFANVTLAAVNGAGPPPQYKVGSRAIQATAAAASDNGLTYMPTANLNLNYYPRLNFMAMSETDTKQMYVRLDDSSFNQAWYYLPRLIVDEWKVFNIPVGRDNENGWIVWDVDSNFDWSDVFAVTFVHDDVVNGELIIDGFYLDNRRYTIDDTYYGYTQNAASITSYGTHEMVHIDDNLSSDADCLRRGEALLYQLKEPVVRVDIETQGNNNVLIGDRLSLTIPAENISAVSYDVVKVTNIFYAQGWITLFTSVNTSDSRCVPSRSNAEFLNRKFAEQRDIGRGLNLLT